MADKVRQRNEALVRAFLDWQQNQRGRSPRTVYDYAHRLASLLDWLGFTPLDAATLQQFESWTQRKRSGNALGGVGRASTQAKDVAVVRSLYNYLEGHRLIALNPTKNLHGPAVHNIAPRPVPEETWAWLWANEQLSDEARVVLGLGFFVGLRRSEIAELRVDQVSPLTQQLMSFKRKGGGTDVTPYGEMLAVSADFLPHLVPGHCGCQRSGKPHAERSSCANWISGPDTFLVPLHALVEARAGHRYLLPWGEQQSPAAISHEGLVSSEGDRSTITRRKRRTHGLADPEANDPDWINRAMRKWLRHVGLDEYEVTPHMLRHGCATYLLKAGLPIEIVAELLNHSNIRVTRRYARLGAPAITAWRKRLRPEGLLPKPLDLGVFPRQ